MMDSAPVDLLIVGAGVTGLAAVLRVERLKAAGVLPPHFTWKIVDVASRVGGNAVSYPHEGATFDVGNHVVHSHYDEFDDLITELTEPVEWLHAVPRGWVVHDGAFVPQPFQLNFHCLDGEFTERCLAGLEARPRVGPVRGRHMNYFEHLQEFFGTGLTDIFFLPLDTKRWGTPLTEVSMDWTSRRSGSRQQNVPAVDIERVLRNMASKTVEPAWSSADTFPYPRSGGNGFWIERLARTLPQSAILLNTRVTSVDGPRRRLALDSGAVVSYGTLISTMPLDRLLAATREPSLLSASRELRYARTTLIGFVVEGALPAHLEDVHWIYAAAPSVPFYRVTIPSNFAPSNAPPGTWTALCEVNEPPTSAETINQLTARSWDGLVREGVIPARSRCRTVWRHRLEHGYPVPFVGRDDLLMDLDGRLREWSVFSRGRFGGWKYEVSDQDHAVAQGFEVVDRIVLGVDEFTYPAGDAPPRRASLQGRL